MNGPVTLLVAGGILSLVLAITGKGSLSHLALSAGLGGYAILAGGLDWAEGMIRRRRFRNGSAAVVGAGVLVFGSFPLGLHLHREAVQDAKAWCEQHVPTQPYDHAPALVGEELGKCVVYGGAFSWIAYDTRTGEWYRVD